MATRKTPAPMNPEALEAARKFAKDLPPVAEKKPRRTLRLRAPGLDDGESPFHPIPGLSSAGEY